MSKRSLKCYTVKLHIETMFLARNQKEAEGIAAEMIREDLGNDKNTAIRDGKVFLSNGLAKGWGWGSTPFGINDEMITVEDALELNKRKERKKEK